MPSAARDHTPPPDPHRFVVDESSFAVQGLSGDQMTHRFDRFNDTLEAIQQDHSVSCSPFLYDTECAPDLALADLLYGPESAIDRDTRLMLMRLLEKCPEWEEPTEGLPKQVDLAFLPATLALSVGFALRHVLRGFAVACVAVPDTGRSGPVATACEDGRAEIFFIDDIREIMHFWRSIFSLEKVPESDFLALAYRAFPDLVFSPDLALRKFHGSYDSVKDWIFHVLGVIHDHLPDVVARFPGQAHLITNAIRPHDVVMTPESSNTRANSHAIRQRDVEHDGVVYRCEWHAKQHWDSNRIHFMLPGEGPNGRAFIGRFVDHLDT